MASETDPLTLSFPFENLTDVALSTGEGSVELPKQPLNSVIIQPVTTGVEVAFLDAPTVGFPLQADRAFQFINGNLGGRTLFFINGTGSNLVKIMVEHGTGN